MRLFAAAIIALVATTIAHAAESPIRERVKWALWMEGVSEFQSKEVRQEPRKVARGRPLPEEIAVALDKFGL